MLDALNSAAPSDTGQKDGISLRLRLRLRPGPCLVYVLTYLPQKQQIYRNRPGWAEVDDGSESTSGSIAEVLTRTVIPYARHLVDLEADLVGHVAL